MTLKSYALHLAAALWTKVSNLFENTAVPGYMVSGVAGVAQAVWGHLFGMLSILWVVAAAWDWIIGRTRAMREDRYDGEVAAQGLSAKAAGYVIILVLWLVEVQVTPEVPYVADMLVQDEGGVVSTVIMMLYLMDELESIDRHRQALGAAPVPLMSRALGLLRDRMLKTVSGPPKRRKGDE